MTYFIKQILSSKKWDPLDMQFANMLVTAVFPEHDTQNELKKTILILASAYLSSNVRLGHTCLPIHLLSSHILLQNNFINLDYKKIQHIKQLTTDDWEDLLCSSPAVGDGSTPSPLILENNNLYLYRMWKDECTVAKFLNYSIHNNDHSLKEEKIIYILNKLFNHNFKKINWHKIASAISIIHPRVFISGGAGIGKTSIISTIITMLLLYNHNLRIQTATTTIKSAAILNDTCKNIVNDLNRLDCAHQYLSISRTTTLHNLLKSRLYHQNNKYRSLLNIDYLIIEEASMISLSILSKLILTLPQCIKVIFLGDHHQLYSIDPGSIFQDICQNINFDYSPQQKIILKKLTGYLLTSNNNSQMSHNYYHITDRICILKQNYRFNTHSGIGQLTSAVKNGNHQQLLSILNSKIYTDIYYTKITKKKDYIKMIIDCSKKYYKYLKKLKNNKNSIVSIFQTFNNYRILCALRYGLFGSKKLNYYIEQTLHHLGLIKLNQTKNYIGKPIIILRNDPVLGLYKGDVGLLLPNSQNNLSAYFIEPKYEIKTIQIYQLPLYETCFAMTIHKAQGLEFQKVSVILPIEHTSILTRELIYTAITRAHQQLFLYSNDKILINSVRNITKRYSGLYDRIINIQKKTYNHS